MNRRMDGRVGDGAWAYRRYVEKHPVAHVPLNIKGGLWRRGAYHLRNVNQYHGQFKRWLAGLVPCAARDAHRDAARAARDGTRTAALRV